MCPSVWVVTHLPAGDWEQAAQIWLSPAAAAQSGLGGHSAHISLSADTRSLGKYQDCRHLTLQEQLSNIWLFSLILIYPLVWIRSDVIFWMSNIAFAFASFASSINPLQTNLNCCIDIGSCNEPMGSSGVWCRIIQLLSFFNNRNLSPNRNAWF